MVRDIDSAYILYGIGALLGIAAILYFGQEVLLSLSPTVKSALLFLTFAAFLTGGLRVDGATVNTVLIILAAGAYIVFLGYTIIRFHPTTNQIFLGLAASSGLFIGIAYAVSEKGVTPTREQGRYLLGGCLLLAAVLIAGDMLGPQATVSTTFQDTIDLAAATDEATIGTIQAENPFILSRTIDLPRYHACLATPNRTEGPPVPVRIDSSRGTTLIGGGETLTHNITIRIPRAASRTEDDPMPAFAEYGTVLIVREDRCPETRDPAALVVTERVLPD